MEEMTAARAAVKFGSVEMGGVATLTIVSAVTIAGGCISGAWAWQDTDWRLENWDWLL